MKVVTLDGKENKWIIVARGEAGTKTKGKNSIMVRGVGEEAVRF